MKETPMHYFSAVYELHKFMYRVARTSGLLINHAFAIWRRKREDSKKVFMSKTCCYPVNIYCVYDKIIENEEFEYEV